jgi:hypothetical protein
VALAGNAIGSDLAGATVGRDHARLPHPNVAALSHALKRNIDTPVVNPSPEITAFQSCANISDCRVVGTDQGGENERLVDSQNPTHDDTLTVL